MISENNKLTILILLVLGFFIYMQYTSVEKLDNVVPVVPEHHKMHLRHQPTQNPMVVPPTQNQMVVPPTQNPVVVTEAVNGTDSSYANANLNNSTQTATDKIVSGATQLTADDLLPKYDAASDFAKENPVSDLLKEQSFLVSGYHMGINTVMQSNKIPYYDLRSAPPIPKQNVGPWAQSSYESFGGASARRQFELSSV